MELRLLTTKREIADVFREWCAKADDIRVVTAWATTDCVACENLTSAISKVSTLIVGRDFYTTSPSFLDSFRSAVRIGQAPGNGVFHPKLYLFRVSKTYCCMIGSSNFTNGGFGDNIELNACVTGRTTDSFFAKVSAFIEAQEERSAGITLEEIADYRKQFDRLSAARKRLARFRAGANANRRAVAKRRREEQGQEPPEQLNKTWKEYVDLILAQEKRPDLVLRGSTDEPGYLETAERCQTLFKRYGRLSSMSRKDRQFVAGITNISGWFGRMGAPRLFKQRVSHDSASLDSALRNIPLTGPLAERMFNAFVASYQRKGCAVGTGSRLLAMKRPDLFVCVNSANRSQIATAFSVSSSSLTTFEGYWNLLLRIWKCPWWRAPQPRHALDRRIWNARVALLDAVYYYPEV